MVGQTGNLSQGAGSSAKDWDLGIAVKYNSEIK